MKFKILIPVYNDWQSVSELLDNIDHNLSGIDHEISVIIVNDASNHDRLDEKKTFNNISSIKIVNMKIKTNFWSESNLLDDIIRLFLLHKYRDKIYAKEICLKI